MSKICVLTSYTDHIRWENYGKCDYGDLSSINHHEYSNKHGYSYIKEIVKNDNYSDWFRVSTVLKYHNKYDIWDELSKKGNNYNFNNNVKIWNSISGSIDINFLTNILEINRIYKYKYLILYVINTFLYS